MKATASEQRLRSAPLAAFGVLEFRGLGVWGLGLRASGVWGLRLSLGFRGLGLGVSGFRAGGLGV